MRQEKCGGGAKLTGHPKAPIPQPQTIDKKWPNHRQKRSSWTTIERNRQIRWFQRLWKKRSAYLGPAHCAYGGQRRSRTWQSHRAAPQASPLVCTAREKDPRQGLRCLRCGPFRAPCPGSPILSGAQTLSPSPYPLAASQLPIW